MVLAGPTETLTGTFCGASDGTLLQRLQRTEFGSIVGNTVLEGQDPHAVGVVTKKLGDAEPIGRRRGSLRKTSTGKGFG